MPCHRLAFDLIQPSKTLFYGKETSKPLHGIIFKLQLKYTIVILSLFSSSFVFLREAVRKRERETLCCISWVLIKRNSSNWSRGQSPRFILKLWYMFYWFSQTYTNADLKICEYLCLHLKIMYWRFHIKIPFTFWDMRTWDMRKVCL